MYLDDPPQVFGIDTTDVGNILARTDALENPVIREKLGKSPSIDEYVKTVLLAGSSCVERQIMQLEGTVHLPGNFW